MPGVLGRIFPPGAIQQNGLPQDLLQLIYLENKFDLLPEAVILTGRMFYLNYPERPLRYSNPSTSINLPLVLFGHIYLGFSPWIQQTDIAEYKNG